jgi:prepilin-type N-terminal cleavage/methylation domain-containing protein
MTDNTKMKQRTGKRGFTLVEMLVVISIIGVLASMVVGLAGGATKQSRMKRVKSDLQNIVTAIDRFKSKYGSYPPDNGRVTVNGGQTNYLSVPNQLFYELVGSVHRLNAAGQSEFYVPQLGLTAKQGDIKMWFGVDGFVNATENMKDVENFLPNFKTNDVARIPMTTQTPLVGLRVAVKNPGTNENFWYYRSTNPTNNPASYDLWAVVVIGRNTNIISNW